MAETQGDWFNDHEYREEAAARKKKERVEGKHLGDNLLWEKPNDPYDTMDSSEEVVGLEKEEEPGKVTFHPEPAGFKNIDTDKITSLEDVKVILKYMRLGISEDMITDDVAHLLED